MPSLTQEQIPVSDDPVQIMNWAMKRSELESKFPDDPLMLRRIAMLCDSHVRRELKLRAYERAVGEYDSEKLRQLIRKELEAIQ